MAQGITEGYFDPHFDGKFNPTGLVKGWAIEKIFDKELLPLLNQPEIVGVSLNGGGDIKTAVTNQNGFVWNVGIENPTNSNSIIGQYALTNNGIATSGISKRSEHIKRNPSSLKQATVISDSLTEADVWATAIMAAGTQQGFDLIRKNELSGVLLDSRLGEIVFQGGEISHA